MPPRLNLPPLTRGLFLCILSLSIFNATLRFLRWNSSLDQQSASQLATTPSNYLSSPRWAVPYLVLIPLQSLKFPWTLLTAALVENNILSLSVSGAVIWFGGRYLERGWGSREFGKFVLFVTVIPNVFSLVVYGVWHALTGTPEHPTPIQGVIALEAGFLVAMKQLVPEHTVSLFRGAVRVRIKHFPALFTLANIISGPLLGTDTAFWLSLTGFLTSWIYLRFYRISEITSATTGEGGGLKMKGDASDTFSFVAFFPDALHPFLSPIADGVYSTLVALKMCTPFSEEAIVAGNESAVARSETLPSIMNPKGGGASGGARRAEAERRRALALRALDQRLNAAAASRATIAPAATTTTDAASTDAVESSAETAKPPEVVEVAKEVEAQA
ncbi:DUF1751-domain-containing protein [Teratosphaeria destructans]|uniref:DUF1751-domain-containing protein n=1 Tax=Teratosphaeria destructans TaxID=418781 RepID=A0A9W7SR39_9PEZI|nr:DUF1751-domain-containing protein [Teratosphaeria destructans]